MILKKHLAVKKILGTESELVIKIIMIIKKQNNYFNTPFQRKDKDGFIALTSVIIINAFLLVIFIGMFFSAAEQIERADSREFSITALGLANSCVEEALNEIKNNIDYSGSETINIGTDDCQIMSVDKTDTTRVVKALGSSNDYTKRVQVEVNIYNHPYLEIIDWRVVSDFDTL
jgi:hypothetical protein